MKYSCSSKTLLQTKARQVEGSIEEIKDAEPLIQTGEGASQTMYTAMKRLTVAIQNDALQGGERVSSQASGGTEKGVSFAFLFTRRS